MGGGYKRKEKKMSKVGSGSKSDKKSPLTISPKIILTIITDWKKIIVDMTKKLMYATLVPEKGVMLNEAFKTYEIA